LLLFAGLGYYVAAGHSLDDADQQHQAEQADIG
jgi:hypothetical protein